MNLLVALMLIAGVPDLGWQAHWEHAEAARGAGDLRAALDHYRAALVAGDRAGISVHMRAAIALGVAESLAGQGDFAAADRELGAAMAALPADRARLRALRTALRASDREAGRDWSQGLRWLRRGEAAGFEPVARALHVRHAWPVATERLRAALGAELDDAQLQALFAAGFASGDAAPVLAALAAARRQRASHALDAAWLAALVEHGGKHEAIAALSEAAAAATDERTRRQHYRAWLQVLARDGDLHAALPVHAALLPIGEHRDHLEHARVLSALGRVDAALAAWAEIMRRWPDDPPRDPRSRAGIGLNAYWGYLRLHLDHGRSAAQIVEHLRRVVRPTDPRIALHLAAAAQHAGMPGLAGMLRDEARRLQ